MHADFERQSREDLVFGERELGQAIAHALGREVALREPLEQGTVARFRGDERAVQLGELSIGEMLLEQPEALAGARLDQRGDEQSIEQRIATRRSGAAEQPLGVGVAFDRAEIASARMEQRDDAREVLELLGGDRGERADELAPPRVARDQGLGRGCGLDLAVRVIGEQRQRIARDALYPFDRRSTQERAPAPASIGVDGSRTASADQRRFLPGVHSTSSAPRALSARPSTNRRSESRFR